MERQSFITPEIRALVGKEESFSSPEELGVATIRRFAAAIGDRNPLYFDDDFAKRTSYGGVIAPPTLIFELNHNIVDTIIEEDGGYSHRVTLPPPLTRYVRGGNEYEFYRPVYPTDKITVRQKIAEISEKEGKAGILVFVTTELTYLNQEGKLLGRNRETFIFMPGKEQ